MKTEATIFALLFLLILAAAGTGVLRTSHEPAIQTTTIRGQSATFQADGIYAYNPVALAREGVVWDVVNLVVGLPLLVASVILALKNNLRGRLLLGGLLAYLFYVYLSCAMMYSFNNLFLVYVAIIALSLVGFFLNLRHIPVQRLPDHFKERFPRRLFAGYGFVLAAALIVLWLGRIIPAMISGTFPPDQAGILTFGSQALDLGLLVPLATATGIYLWKRTAIGYLLCSIAMPVGLMMSIAIPSWITVPLIQTGSTNLMEALPFYLLSLAGFALAGTFFFGVQTTATGLELRQTGSVHVRARSRSRTE